MIAWIWQQNHNLLSKLCYMKALHNGVLQWRLNGSHGVSKHRRLNGLLNRLFSNTSKKTSKLHVTGLCEGNSPVTDESPHKGPVTRKMFPFDDVFMDITDDVTLWLWMTPPAFMFTAGTLRLRVKATSIFVINCYFNHELLVIWYAMVSLWCHYNE